jgi:hypothetical protein
LPPAATARRPSCLNALLRISDCDVAQIPATHNWMCHRALSPMTSSLR